MKRYSLFGILLFFTSVIFVSSCSKDSDERKIIDKRCCYLTVASHKVPGTIFGSGCSYLAEVYAVKKDNSQKWVPYPIIKGFNYFQGHEYYIHVEETTYLDNRMGDPAWTEYKFIETLSVQEKESENVPAHLIENAAALRSQKIDVQYLIQADDKTLVENDLKQNPMIPWNCRALYIPYYYVLFNSKTEVCDSGNYTSKIIDASIIPDKYKLLVKSTDLVKYAVEINSSSLMNVNGHDGKYLAIVTERSSSVSAITENIVYIFCNFTEYYKAKYPDVSVDQVIVALSF